MLCGAVEYKWDVTFTHLQQIDSGDVDMLAIESSSLFGTNVQSNILEKNKGTSKTYQQIQLLPNTNSELEGTFTVSFRGLSTVPMPYNVEDSIMKRNLESLVSVGLVTSTRTGTLAAGYTWNIVFDTNIGTLPNLVVDQHSSD